MSAEETSRLGCIIIIDSSRYVGEACYIFSVGSVLSNVRKRKEGSKWKKQFTAGLQVRDMFSFNQFLNLYAEATHSSTRHDLRFGTPLGRQRRFKVWILGNQKDGTGPGQAFSVRPLEHKSIEGGQKVCCGVLLFHMIRDWWQTCPCLNIPLTVVYSSE